MVESYDLIFLVITYIIAIISVIIFILSALFIIIEFCIYKKNTYKAITYTFLGISIIGIYLTLPWCFLGLATNTNSSKAESYYKMAVNTALLPTVKSYMLYNLGKYNETISKNGDKAIENYEKAISNENIKTCNPNNLNNNSCKDYIFISLVSLCYLYSYKQDTNNCEKVCNAVGLQYITAEHYIQKRDYNNALAILNTQINNPDQKDNNLGRAYAMRAYIYEKLGKHNEAKKEFETAKKFSNSQIITELQNNNNYYEDFYNKQRLEYKF